MNILYLSNDCTSIKPNDARQTIIMKTLPNLSLILGNCSRISPSQGLFQMLETGKGDAELIPTKQMKNKTRNNINFNCISQKRDNK